MGLVSGQLEIASKLPPHLARGAAFDCTYINAQYENHVFLRDLAMVYLGNPPQNTNDMAETQERHLATRALATFKEHTLITQRITHELQ